MQQIAETENNEQPDIPNRERKHFPYNISKIGHAIFTVSMFKNYDRTFEGGGFIYQINVINFYNAIAIAIRSYYSYMYTQEFII